MHRRALIVFSFTLTLTSFFAEAQQGGQVLTRGDEIMDFSLIDVVSREQISLSDYSSKSAVVVVFSSTHCPYSKIYEERITALYQEYSSKNVGFVLINSNNSALDTRDSQEGMRIHAQKLEYSFPYLADKENIARDIFNAEKTPETFILIPDGDVFRVAYQGAIDDNPQSPDQVDSNYVRMSLNNIVEQKPSPVAYKRPVGCRIKSQ